MVSYNLNRFIRFLKEGGVYAAFLNNFNASRKRYGKSLNFFDSHDYSKIIDRTLIWDETNEGYDFWFEINNYFENKDNMQYDMEEFRILCNDLMSRYRGGGFL